MNNTDNNNLEATKQKFLSLNTFIQKLFNTYINHFNNKDMIYLLNEKFANYDIKDLINVFNNPTPAQIMYFIDNMDICLNTFSTLTVVLDITQLWILNVKIADIETKLADVLSQQSVFCLNFIKNSFAYRVNCFYITEETDDRMHFFITNEGQNLDSSFYKEETGIDNSDIIF